jgi:sigma-54 interacting transcriptional regulator
LEEQGFERIGSPQTIATDVRIVAATNRPLGELVGEGYYYRLNRPSSSTARSQLPGPATELVINGELARLAGREHAENVTAEDLREVR